jgi:hypothetical protein
MPLTGAALVMDTRQYGEGPWVIRGRSDLQNPDPQNSISLLIAYSTTKGSGRDRSSRRVRSLAGGRVVS